MRNFLKVQSKFSVDNHYKSRPVRSECSSCMVELGKTQMADLPLQAIFQHWEYLVRVRKDLIGTLMEGLDDVVKDAKTYMITRT